MSELDDLVRRHREYEARQQAEREVRVRAGSVPDTGWTEEVVCPWCAHVHSDSWEMLSPSEESGTASCQECGKGFHLIIHTQINYESSREAP